MLCDKISYFDLKSMHLTIGSKTLDGAFNLKRLDFLGEMIVAGRIQNESRFGGFHLYLSKLALINQFYSRMTSLVRQSAELITFNHFRPHSSSTALGTYLIEM